MKWFTSYLEERSLVAKIQVLSNKIVYSKKYNIVYGTAQGSCLGPLLFILFCNDVYLLDTYGSLILFTDDTLFNKYRSVQGLRVTLTHDMEILSDWCSVNKLSLNMTNTMLMYFGKSSTNFEICVNNTNIP